MTRSNAANLRLMGSLLQDSKSAFWSVMRAELKNVPDPRLVFRREERKDRAGTHDGGEVTVYGERHVTHEVVGHEYFHYLHFLVLGSGKMGKAVFHSSDFREERLLCAAAEAGPQLFGDYATLSMLIKERAKREEKVENLTMCLGWLHTMVPEIKKTILGVLMEGGQNDIEILDAVWHRYPRAINLSPLVDFVFKEDADPKAMARAWNTKARHGGHKLMDGLAVMFGLLEYSKHSLTLRYTLDSLMRPPQDVVSDIRALGESNVRARLKRLEVKIRTPYVRAYMRGMLEEMGDEMAADGLVKLERI